MNRNSFVLTAAMLLVALAAGQLAAQTTPGKVIPGAVKHPPVITVERLAQEADVIAVGRVSAMRAEWNEDRSRIQTRVTIAVEKSLKGPTATDEVTILVPGGEVDGVGELYTHMATFHQDEDVLVFATKDAKGELRVTQGPEGKYLIEKDAKSGARAVPGLGSMDDVSARIARSVKTGTTEPTRN
jgi:hypothetical protein